MVWKKIKLLPWLEMLFLTLLSGFVYLPRSWELTYNKDDWYFMYDGLVRGAEIFRDITLHTRPLRGFLYEFLYSLFGPLPLPYHLTAYLWRLLGGFGALWLFNLLWPNRRSFNFSLAALFLLFPGFYWWVSGFELQPNVISVGLEAFSIAFTLKAIEENEFGKRILYILASFLCGWIYMAFVEYAIGMEGFRLLCVYLLVSRKHSDLTLAQSAWQTIRTYAIFFLIPIGFVIWYEFFFENWRKAQDAALQLAALFTSPLTFLWWSVRLIQSTLNISLLAWFVPFHENFISNRLRDILLGSILAIATITAFLAGNSLLKKRIISKESPNAETQSRFQFELMGLGLLGTIAGVIPIVVANRSAVFSHVSQYTLPASLSGVLLIGGIIYSIFPDKLRLIMLSVLIGFAALSHHGLAAKAVAEHESIANFWWQVTWRAPLIRNDTLLVVRYPRYIDNDEMVWGPANFIYNPQPQQQSGPVKVPISASPINKDAITNILMGSKEFDTADLVIKYVSIHYDYKNILVITQPVEESCIHLIDQRWPDISQHDELLISMASSRSNAEKNVILDAKTPVPQEYIFGNEPRHEWCYYYQKADQARQQGKWNEITILAQEATSLGLHPNDQIEWMPFLQAYAFLDNQKKVKQISKFINTEAYYKQQACQNLGTMDDHGYPLSLEMQAYVDEVFCSAENK